MRPRWRDNLLITNRSIIGTVSQGAGGGWFAYGCMTDWEDTRLGAHETEEAARKAVEEWVKSVEAEDVPA